MERHVHGHHQGGNDDRRDIRHRVQSSAIDDHRICSKLHRESVDRFRGVRVQGQQHREDTISVHRTSDIGASLHPRQL